jgi:hypothetical protein
MYNLAMMHLAKESGGCDTARELLKKVAGDVALTVLLMSSASHHAGMGSMHKWKKQPAVRICGLYAVLSFRGMLLADLNLTPYIRIWSCRQGTQNRSVTAGTSRLTKVRKSPPLCSCIVSCPAVQREALGARCCRRGEKHLQMVTMTAR